MTIVNVLVEAEAVSIICDTRAKAGAGKRFEVTKCRVFPHMRVMIATRGRLAALDKFGRLVQEFATDYESAIYVIKTRITDGTDEVYLAGWGLSGPAACLIKAENGQAAVTHIPYASLSPSIPTADYAKFAEDPIAGMPAALAAQARRSSACGGWANVCSMGRQATTVYTMPVPIPEPRRVLER